jgi:hypothetical protein
MRGGEEGGGGGGQGSEFGTTDFKCSHHEVPGPTEKTL